MLENARAHFNRYPIVLWALALFLLCLGFSFRVDLPLAMLAGAAAFAFQQHSGDARWRNVLQQHWALFGFLLTALLATWHSHDIEHSLAVQPQLLAALLTYAVITLAADSPARQQFLVSALLASGMLTAGLMIVSIKGLGIDDPLAQVELIGNALFVVPNDVLMLSIIAPLALANAWQGGTTLRLLTALYLLLALLAGIMIQSRQAALILLLGLVAVCTLLKPRWAIPALLAGSALAIGADAVLGWPLLHKIHMFPRTYVWQSAWLMFLDEPLLGQGPGTFKNLYYAFVHRAGYIFQDLPDHRLMPWAHSLYLEQLAERGVIGLVGLLAVFWQGVQDCLKALRQADQRTLAAGLLAAWLALAVAGIAEASLLRLWVTVIMLILLAMSRRLHLAAPATASDSATPTNSSSSRKNARNKKRP